MSKLDFKQLHEQEKDLLLAEKAKSEKAAKDKLQ